VPHLNFDEGIRTYHYFIGGKRYESDLQSHLEQSEELLHRSF